MKVRVSSLGQAEEQAKDWADRVISLIDPGQELPNFHTWHLIIRCEDVQILTDPWSPKLQDIKSVFDFCQPADNVLIHCAAGIPRSTAMAIGLLIGDGLSVVDACKQVHQQRPNMSPNKLILQHIDTYLNLGGTLVSQVQEVMNTLPKDLWLWCDTCKKYFIDSEEPHGCPSWSISKAKFII